MERVIHCLMIDDDEDDQEIFALCLSRISRSIQLETADDGVRAIAMLTSCSYTPDYIFIDVNMPRMNGIECLAQIRAIDRLRDSRVYMHSTTTGRAVSEQSKKLGADGFIIKPTRPIELQEKLSEIFLLHSSDTK